MKLLGRPLRTPRLSRIPLGDPAHRARVWMALKIALAFLTVIPIRFKPAPDEPSASDVAAARYAIPVVGLSIGAVLALASLGLSYFRVSPLLASFLLVALWATLSGGLHLDGLADTTDGLFLWGDAERRLAAMRDPHIGAFGTLALVLLILGKFAALASLAGQRRALAVLGRVGCEPDLDPGRRGAGALRASRRNRPLNGRGHHGC